MIDLTDTIAQADNVELDGILKAIVQRYTALFPDWELCVISLEKTSDRNEQLDRMIAMLQKMKEHP